jgi:threonine dehydrogenase-like Zn-dependent dehydrogenase
MSRRGLPQKAPDLFKYGHELIRSDSTLHGGLADYCVLRRHTPVVRIDAPIPLPLMALINCSVATVAGSLRLASPVRNAHVVIAGAGMLGIIACAMCRCAGAGRIIALDVDDARLATARRFGVDFAVNLHSDGPPLKEKLAAPIPGEPVTVVLDYSGVPETMEALLSLLGIGGTAVFIGATFPQRALQINAEQLIRNVHTIKGLHNYNEQDFIAAVEFMEQNHRRFPFESLVHDGFDLESVDAAFDYGLKSGAHRVGVRIGPKP